MWKWRLGWILGAACFLAPLASSRASEPLLAPQGQVHVDDDLLLPVSVNLRWGYINGRGEIVIPPRFIGAGNFHEGLALVRAEKSLLYGFIGRDGNFIIEPQWKSAGEFSNGRAYIFDGKKSGYINQQGAIVIPCIYDRAERFQDGVALVGKGTPLGLLTAALGGPTACSLFYIDANGAPLETLEENGPVANQSNRLLPLRSREKYGRDGDFAGKMGYVNLQGKFVIDPQFDWAGDFRDGLAPVKVNGKVGFIDERGEMKIAAQFFSASEFSEGLSTVTTMEGQMGAINANGEFVIEPKFDHLDEFSEGLAAFRDSSGKEGYLNSKGLAVIHPQFAHARAFTKGIAQVIDEKQRIGYINRSGEFIWKPSR